MHESVLCITFPLILSHFLSLLYLQLYAFARITKLELGAERIKGFAGENEACWFTLWIGGLASRYERILRWILVGRLRIVVLAWFEILIGALIQI